MSYIFLENLDNRIVFGVIGIFIIIGLIGVHVDTTPYTSGWEENGIWIYSCAGLWLFWFGANVVKYYLDKPEK